MTESTQPEGERGRASTVGADQKPLIKQIWFWLFALPATFAMPTVKGLPIPHVAAEIVGVFVAIFVTTWVAWRISNRSTWLPVVVLAVFLCAALFRPTDRTGHSAAAGIVSGPTGSEFTVQFPQEPRTTQTTAYTGEGEPVAAERMEFISEAGLLRAEFMPYGSRFAGIPGKDAAFAVLRKWSEDNGLSGTALGWEETALGKCATLRGTKTLESGAARESVTYSIRMIFGEHSCLMVTVGGSASSYPFPGATEFLQSVARRWSAR